MLGLEELGQVNDELFFGGQLLDGLAEARNFLVELVVLLLHGLEGFDFSHLDMQPVQSRPPVVLRLHDFLL